jgi:hypothetical protein
VTTEEEERRALSLRRVKRARDHLKSARDLLAAEDFADSVSRSYYAFFQAARALLRKVQGEFGLYRRKNANRMPVMTPTCPTQKMNIHLMMLASTVARRRSKRSSTIVIRARGS